MIAAVVVAILAVAALAYVGAPLRRFRPQSYATAGITEAEARKRAALLALLELEEDRAVDKLSEDDFLTLRAEYEAEAVAALKQLDLFGTEGNDPLEAEIAASRRRLERESQSRPWRSHCPSCGAPRPAGEVCPRCGV